MSAPDPQLNERVEAILRAACRVVLREGAHRLRMASVADDAGVSKALVHYYFSTRRELLRSAFAFSEEQWERALAAGSRSLPSGAARLEHLLLASIDAGAPSGERGAFWNEVWSSLRLDDDLRPSVADAYRSWLDRLARLVEEGRSDGSIPAAVDAGDAAWRLAAVADGLDSQLYLGLVDRDRARALLRGSIARELATA